MMTMSKDETDAIDLWARNYMFAIEDVDPLAGYIYADHTSWGPGKNQKNTEGKLVYEDKKRVQLEMVDCLSFLEDPDYENFHISTKLLVQSIQNTKKGTRFLCPTNLESLTVRGHYGASHFDYVRIQVNGCNLG